MPWDGAVANTRLTVARNLDGEYKYVWDRCEEGATPTARVSLAEATPIADPRALPTVTEKEDLRQSLMKRSRTDSVVLARSASVRRQHTLSICWH